MIHKKCIHGSLCLNLIAELKRSSIVGKHFRQNIKPFKPRKIGYDVTYERSLFVQTVGEGGRGGVWTEQKCFL